jgi:ubiquinone/menaquinone biosynthesis C-methylase UbiE
MVTDDKPLGRRNYEQFASRYADAAPTKIANALYERPATLSLLPQIVAGLDVLDAGCGPGIYSEILARRGARVHAIDVTPEMIEIAGSRLAGLGVEIRQADLARPLDWLPDRRFDLILSPLALDYIADWHGVFAEFHRVARQSALLVFSVGHPMNEWRLAGASGAYHDTELFSLEWKGFGEPKPRIDSYRRPLEAMINPLVAAGWIVDRILEPRPSEVLRAADAEFYDTLTRSPYFLCVRARRA